jgi:hypothetical protein
MAIDPTALKLAQEVSRVLMPHAWTKRDKVVADGARFVHYTSAAAGLSIISTKTIWTRNTTCMADYSEVQHGLRKLTSDPNLLQPLVRLLDAELSNAGTEAIALFDHWSKDTQFQTYITSISEHDPHEDLHGRLSMWRAFGGQTARVAFVLKIPIENNVGAALNVWLSPVAYFRDDQLAREFQNVHQNVTANLGILRNAPRHILIGAIFIMLVSAVVCLKHEGFHEEREWRIVYNPKRVNSPLMQFSVEVIGGVPQTIYKIPINGDPPDQLGEINIGNLLDRVIIGPSPYPWAMYEAFVSELIKAGVPDAAEKVLVSGIPLRS